MFDLYENYEYVTGHYAGTDLTSDEMSQLDLLLDDLDKIQDEPFIVRLFSFQLKSRRLQLWWDIEKLMTSVRNRLE